MGSIRARLTAAYTAAFIGTLVIFSIALLAVRREILFRELEAQAQADLDQLHVEGDFAAWLLDAVLADRASVNSD